MTLTYISKSLYREQNLTNAACKNLANLTVKYIEKWNALNTAKPVKGGAE